MATEGARYWCHTCSEYVDTREGRDHELQCDSCSSNFVELVNEDGSSDDDDPSAFVPPEYNTPAGATATAGSGAQAAAARATASAPPSNRAGATNPFAPHAAAAGAPIISTLQSMLAGSQAMLPPQFQFLGVPSSFGAGPGSGPGAPRQMGDYAFGDLTTLMNQLMMNDGNQHGPPPAAKQVLDSLKPFKLSDGDFDDGEECTVCRCEYEDEDMAIRLPCKHLFHDDCILPWLKQHNNCPVCREALPTDDDDYNRRHRLPSADSGVASADGTGAGAGAGTDASDGSTHGGGAGASESGGHESEQPGSLRRSRWSSVDDT